MDVSHLPDRATYDCVRCNQEWPCETAREYLKESTPDPVQLAIRLWVELDEAVLVLSQQAPAALFQRFLRWARYE
ncbi:hypothetical protein AB0F72_19545 [Actinoplanes sp. NPDC023936]|uniref:hypothetical protein n=1 Tax=Actinoplanes sp. NPDC023936 TaxID=3154910 RepID=UPI0033CEE078